jgi:hypothetical protein
MNPHATAAHWKTPSAAFVSLSPCALNKAGDSSLRRYTPISSSVLASLASFMERVRTDNALENAGPMPFSGLDVMRIRKFEGNSER